MSIPQFVDGETDLDSITFNRIVNRVNAITDGTAPIALPGIAGALGEWEPTSRAETRLLDARSRGAVADGVTDDRQALLDAAEDAISQKIPLWIPGVCAVDGPLDFTEFYGISIIGSGHNASPAYARASSRIIQQATNEPILKVWGPCVVRDLYLDYATQQTVSDTAAIALELNEISAGYFANLKIYRANTSVGIPQVGFGVGSDNWVFSSVFDNLQLYQASECFFDLRGYNGGNTNVAVHNLYLNGGGTADFSQLGQECNHAIRGANWKGWHFDTMSIDACTFNDSPIETANCIWNAGSIRFEACQMTQNDANWIEDTGGHSSFHLGSLEMKNDRWIPDTPGQMYLVRAAASYTVLTIGDVYCDSDCNFGASGTRRVLSQTAVDVGSGYVSQIEIGALHDASGTLSDVTSWVQGNATDMRVPVHRWDSAYVNWWLKAGRTGNRRRVTVDVGIPTVGTYTAGDRCLVLTPALGLPSEYVCTTGGTPGTWRPASQTVKRDTTANRPSPAASDIGILYLDTTLDADGKPIWWNGTAWVDATGATV